MDKHEHSWTYTKTVKNYRDEKHFEQDDVYECECGATSYLYVLGGDGCDG